MFLITIGAPGSLKSQQQGPTDQQRYIAPLVMATCSCYPGSMDIIICRVRAKSWLCFVREIQVGSNESRSISLDFMLLTGISHGSSPYRITWKEDARGVWWTLAVDPAIKSRMGEHMFLVRQPILLSPARALLYVQEKGACVTSLRKRVIFWP